MATSNKKINVTTLDFDDIKTNLKTFLSGQTEFQDYDFEGSAMSVLLDVLAYNTHYNALYNNLAINEMFLDSARKRNSVVSLSKMLGYSPRSATCATATITLTVSAPSSGATTLTLPAYTPFTTTIDGASYTFYTTGSVVATSSTGVFTFSDLVITEGTPLTFNITVGTNTRYIIPNSAIDLDTLTVRIQDSASSSVYTTFTKAETLIGVDSTTKCYWVKEIDEGLYELTFGDGNLGMELDTGNIVHLNYFVSSLDAPNKARQFTYGGGTLISGASISITTTSIAANGAAAEDIDSIRFNAPRMYASQNRAVTPDDYKAIVYSQFSDAASVTCWGGEDNNPPVYGKAFIAIKPLSGETFSNATKEQITTTILKGRNVVSIIPEVVDAQYLYIIPTTTLYYNPQQTNRSEEQLKTLVRDTIVNYNQTDLNRFDGMFRFSKLSRLIDASEESILSNITTLVLKRSFTPTFNTRTSYVITIDNPIYTEGVPEGAVTSDAFTIEGSSETFYFEDDGVGAIRLYYFVGAGTKRYINANLGTVNYTTGAITLNDINITSATNNEITITIKPSSNDVVSVRSQLALIAEEQIVVNAVVDKVASGETSGGSNYIFTSSRS
jgi:hypothetical protein